jgi:cytochrome c2
MHDRSIAAGNLDEQGAADLLAYFYSMRFFEKPGDAGRGKAVFAAKHCEECHGLSSSKIPEAKPISQWESIDQPIQLMTAMWNHGANMRAEFQKRKFGWPELSSQDLSDLLVYVRSLPVRNTAPALRLSAGSTGQALFDSKGCAACHTGKNALAPKLKGKTLTDIAADMWNHQPKMSPNPPVFSSDEMRELVSFLWAGQFFAGDGNAAAGARVFTAKHCAGCHNDSSSGAPKLNGQFTAATMVSALWHHGPSMAEQMKSRHLPWPRFDGQDMANLIAYLNTRK